jgi:hypothetical protein
MSKAVRVNRDLLRGAQTSAALVAVLVGSVLAVHTLPRARVPHLARYIYGDRGGVQGVVDRLPAALRADVWFVSGYGLVLLGFAWIFLVWAASASGRMVAVYVAAAVAITVIADLAKDGLLYLTVHHQDSTRLMAATSAAATIKWCALVLALGGIVAAAGIFLRAVAAWLRYLRARFSEDTNPKWWNHVLEELPGVQSPDPATPTVATDDSWIKAYNVPGANNVIAGRKGEPVQAICLSGGGVRSACVAMGAMQEFSKAPPVKAADIMGRFRDGADPQLIDAVDYVISVSGGGYSAGARLLAVQPSETISEEPLLSQRFEDGSVEFDHFRRGSSYIADSPGGLILALAEVLKNLVASMTILFIVPILLGWVSGYLLSRPDFSFAAFVPVPNPKVNDGFKHAHPDYLLSLTNHPASWWAVGFFALWAVLLATLAILVELFFWSPRSEAVKLWMQRIAVGSAVFALLVLTVVAGLPALMRLCSTLSLHAAHNQGAAAAAVSGVVGLNYLAAVSAMAWKKGSRLSRAGLTKLSWWRRLLPPGVFSLILVVVTLVVLAVAWLITLGSVAAGVFRYVTLDGLEGTHRHMPNWQFWLLGLALTALWISAVDITSVSLHPYYRHRLARTFAVRRIQISSGGWRAERYPRTAWTWLPEFGSVPAGGPRFVFAAAATVTGEGKPAPGLNAVSYVLSSDYIGSPELGWLKTPQLFREAPPRIKRDLTVMAAVAVSGAAFASAMGRSQKGFEKLLAVSGARLGTWLPNPNFVANLAGTEKGTCIDSADNKRPWPKSLPTIRGAGYYYRELFGFNYNDARLVQVTDGGHYENLGLVEALRRRSRLIFCIDGGGDTPPLLSGLADAMRLAKYELGVTITFDVFNDYKLGSVAPGSGKSFEINDALYRLNSRLSKRTVAIGKINYPAASGLPGAGRGRQGFLIFAKAVLCEGCPQWLLTYAASNNAFPHDPTSDQWFNEGQFAAYTELGRIMAQEALDCINFLIKENQL